MNKETKYVVENVNGVISFVGSNGKPESLKPDEVKIDGNHVPNFDEVGHSFSLNSVMKGDEKIQEISAASILAKVYRDRYMNFIHYRYPNYNFYINKGYPTKDHVDRLGVFGLSPYHRISFKPCSFYQEKNIYE